MNTKLVLSLALGLILLTGCSFPGSAAPTPTPFTDPGLIFIATETPVLPTPIPPTPIFTPTATPIPPVAANVCNDPQVIALLDALKSSMLTANGETFGPLVSPNGMQVRYFRDAKPITYTAHQAKFLFVTTYQAPWGNDPASGQEKKGAFHDVIVPELVRVFNAPYTVHCNEIRHGGASYQVTWPYNKDFYSIYYTGTETNGYLDWRTWTAGIEYVNNKPYLYALVQYFWEP
jgi:hypothetical protein